MRNIQVLLFCILFLSCEKDPIPINLPPNTTSGENTFGCYINGEIYIPEHRTVTLQYGPIELDFPSYPDYVFGVFTNRVVHKTDKIEDADLSFVVKNINEEGTYRILFGNVIYNSKKFSVDSLCSGELVITRFDSTEKIISGTFNFVAKNEFDNEVVNVTNGRFDLKK